MKPLTKLKRRPTTLVELFSNPKRWTKDALNTADNVACCIVGGANFIRHGVFSYWDSDKREPTVDFEELSAKINKVARVRDFDIVCWNNDPKLTHKKFLSVLKKAKV